MPDENDERDPAINGSDLARIALLILDKLQKLLDFLREMSEQPGYENRIPAHLIESLDVILVVIESLPAIFQHALEPRPILPLIAESCREVAQAVRELREQLRAAGQRTSTRVRRCWPPIVYRPDLGINVLRVIQTNANESQEMEADGVKFHACPTSARLLELLLDRTPDPRYGTNLPPAENFVGFKSVEQLAVILGAKKPHNVDVWISRARQDFRKGGMDGAVIETRDGCVRIRLRI